MPVLSTLGAATAKAWGFLRQLASAGGNGDPYFQYVTSLLHGDGTNGGQNNTFLDSSTNAFTITRNGNTTQGSFSPYGSNWGNYFNGSSYLGYTNNTGMSFGTGDFTVEAWVNFNSVSTGQQCIITGGYASNTGWNMQFRTDQSTTPCIYFAAGDSNAYTSSKITPIAGQWNHFAVSRSGNTLYFFLNGVAAGTASVTGISFDKNSATSIVGGLTTGGVAPTTGYISNVRVVKGTALYTAAFTPSTTPLTAITNTQLLTCQSSRFIDNSTNAYAVTVTGTPQVTRFSPFAPTYSTQYSTSTIGGSGYFDGTGDYVNAPNNTAFQIGTGDFTYECWFYPTNIGGSAGAQQFIFGTGSSGGLGIGVWSGTLQYGYTDLANLYSFSSSAIINNQWTHFAVSRSGSTMRSYINGTLVNTTSNSTNFSSYDKATVGAYWDGSTAFKGYITDAKFTKGTAVYTGSTLTVPTAPVSAGSSTMLLSMQNAAIYDNSMIPNYETVGNAQISTSVYKYGTGSLAFDGSGDYLKAANTVDTDFGSGNFTIELWYYFNTTGSDQWFASKFDFSSPERGWGFRWSTSAGLRWVSLDNSGNYVIIDNAWTPTTGTWYHIAFSKVGSTAKVFVNGTQVGTTQSFPYSVGTTSSSILFQTGGNSNASGGQSNNGYIDDFRITKGYARYWENFTPPDAALPNFGGAFVAPTQDPQFNYTTMLLPGTGTNGAQNNTFLDSSANTFTITRNGNTTQGTFTPFSQTGWSVYPTTSGDFTTSSALMAYGTGTKNTDTFTCEAWVYVTSYGSPPEPAQQMAILGKGSIQFSWGVYSDGKLCVYSYDGTTRSSFSAGTVTLNQWVYVAFTVSGGTITHYINGYPSGTGTWYGMNTTSDALRLARSWASASTYWNGYISNLRISTTARTIAPVTSAFTNDASTAFLTFQSNRFIDNSSNAYSITVANGSPQVQAFSPYAPTAPYSTSTVGGSGYFDGSGDYLSIADSSAFNLSNNNFTIDGWAYIDANSNQGVIVAQDNGNPAQSSFRVEWDGTINGRVYIGSTEYTLTGTSDRRNGWTHFALVRNGSTVYLYVNGVEEATASVSTSSINDSSVALTLGATSTGGTRPTGYISNVRLVNGTAVYTSAFTPPTAPTTAVTNTQLLVNFTNAGITDATAKNDLETVGNAQISTGAAKFGSTSIAFDGSGDYLTNASNYDVSFNTGDFTIEGWVYWNSLASESAIMWGSGVGWTFYIYPANKLQWGTTSPLSPSNLLTGSTTLATGRWYHIAVTRYNGTVTLWVNGLSDGSVSDTSNYSAQGKLQVGISHSSEYFNGYMQDVRITKGYARYVQPFTPPTQAFQLY